MVRKDQAVEPDEWVTVAACARAVPCTEAAVRRWIGMGVVERRADGKVHLRTALAAMSAARAGTAGPGRGGLKEPPESMSDSVAKKPKSLVHWKTAEARESALMKRLSRLEKQGQLVRRDVAEAEAATVMATLRSHLDSVGRSLQDALAAETDPRRCGDMVEGAIRKVLDRLADTAPEEDEDG